MSIVAATARMTPRSRIALRTITVWRDIGCSFAARCPVVPDSRTRLSRPWPRPVKALRTALCSPRERLVVGSVASLGESRCEAGGPDDDEGVEGDPEVDREHHAEAAVVLRVEVDPGLD